MASIVKCLRSIADPTRLRLLSLLHSEELSVAELQEILDMGQSRISSHLAQLKQAGLVRDRRAGKNIYYALAPETTDPWRTQLSELVRTGAAELPEAARDATALRLALEKRRDKAREYFDRVAGRLGRSYCPGRTWKGLSQLLLELVPPLVIADLGAGEGTLAQLLAKRAKKVIAVDNSRKMVEFGAALAERHGFSNLEYRLGDLEAPPIPARSVDLAIFSQALHHAVHPVAAVAAAHRILKPGGRLMILDLLSHTFEQARDLYADLWLGFAEVELHEMLEQAGFRDIAISIVAKESQPPHFQTILAAGTK